MHYTGDKVEHPAQPVAQLWENKGFSSSAGEIDHIIPCPNLYYFLTYA